MKWLALGTALSAALFSAINLQGQVVGPNSKGGFNAYSRNTTNKGFFTAEEDARATTFPGFSVNGVEIIPANSTKGHLLTLQGAEEHQFVLKAVGTGWLGLSDDSTFDDSAEGDNESGMPYPAFKTGSKELRNVAAEGERGYGWVWTTGEPFEYQAWNGGEPNNSGGAENAAELTSNGYNDLGTQEIPSLIEWDLNLKSNPIQMNLDLSVQGGKLAGKVEGVTSADFGSKALPGESWYVTQRVEHVLRAPGNTPVPGLQATFLNGNLTSDGAWTSALANAAVYQAPTFLLDKISYGGDTPNDLPPASGFASRASGNNQENYSVQWQGEIFIPQGTVNFYDGNDDYAKLVIDGNTLYEDNNWTSWDGTGNNGSTATGSFVGTKNDVTIDGLKGGWYSIQFRGAEGGGGDNFRLVWDATNKGVSGADEAAYANPNVDADTYFTVAPEFFRATDPGLVIAADLRLGQFDSAGKAAGYMGTDGVNGELPSNGSTINLSGMQNLTLHASIAGQQFSFTKAVDFGGAPTLPGDIDGNGKVDLTDFGILKANFGKSAPAGAAVPEPSTLALLGLGGLCSLIAAIRRRRK